MCVRFLASDLLDHAVSSLKVGRRRELEHERGQVPLMRREDEEERHDERREHAVEVQGLRREPGGQDRQLRQEARRVPGLVALQEEAGGHARGRQDVQAADRRVLAPVAAASRDGRGLPGGLRGRHLPGAQGLRADLQERGARAGVVRLPLGELAVLRGAHGQDRASRRRGHRRRARVPEGEEAALARHEGAALHVPRVRAGEEVHHHAAQDPGGGRPLRAGERPPEGGVLRAGRRLARCLREVVLRRLPGRGDHGRRRAHLPHPRETRQGQELAHGAREAGHALHLRGPRPGGEARAAAGHQQRRGEPERPAQGDAQGAPRPLPRASHKGRLLVVLHAHGVPDERGGDPQGDAHRREHRQGDAVDQLREQGVNRTPEVGRRARVGGAPQVNSVEKGLGLGGHTFCPITLLSRGLSCLPCRPISWRRNTAQQH